MPTTPTYTGTSGNDAWTVVGAGSFILDGLGGVDTLSLGTSLRTAYTIALAADGGVHIDTLSGASAPLHATLYNMEKLYFNSGRDLLDLTSYFNRTVTGTDNADNLIGTAANETINALGGNDVITGGTGNDTIDGGAGMDTVNFTGNRSDYSIVKTGGNETVADKTASRDGTDSLSNVEVLHFADRSVDLGAGIHSQTIAAADLKTLEELYVGFFNRIPEASGLGYWIDQIHGGTSLTGVANQFYDAGVAFGVYSAGATNAEFITAVYANVLGRTGATAPNASEIAYWNSYLTDPAHAAQTKGTMVQQMLHDVHTYFENDPTYGFVAALLNNKAAVANYYAVQEGLSLNVQADNVSFGVHLASLITPTDTGAAIGLVGLSDTFTTF